MRIYVAGPIEKGHQFENVAKAIHIADELFLLGCVPFIPHLNCFWDMLHPHVRSTWLRYDRAWIDVCDALYRIEGDSAGSDEEVEYALKIGIPVFYSLKEVMDYRMKVKA